MKLNERQRELAESALQAPEWKDDKRAAWALLLIGIVLAGIFSGPMTALVCLTIAVATVVIFSWEPFTGLVLLVAALFFGALQLHSEEVVFALAYLLLVVGIGVFWILRSIRFESVRSSSLRPREDSEEQE